MIVYLASPYTHPDGAVREARWIAALRATAALTELGNIVFSPIAHYHPVDFFLQPKEPEFWDRTCEAYMARCGRCVVLMVDGWDESRGVLREIDWFQQRGLSVTYMADDA